MQRPDASPDASCDASPDASEQASPLRSLLRLAFGFVALLVVLAVVGWAFRADLERFGKWFVARFGAPGMAAGAFLADGVHFPLPPQFFLFTGIAGGYSTVKAMISVSIGSILGGYAAFLLSRKLARFGLFGAGIREARKLLERTLDRHGSLGLVLVGILPISYWALCTVAGLMRLPPRAYAVLAVMRIPRLLLSYVVILAAWRSGAT